MSEYANPSQERFPSGLYGSEYKFPDAENKPTQLTLLEAPSNEPGMSSLELVPGVTVQIPSESVADMKTIAGIWESQGKTPEQIRDAMIDYLSTKKYLGH